ncbi:MAG: hypothetical protein H7Z41_08935 [Cytophagales bacterium]|nr:hypothetical protein [Armatimonadota bacterium]
MRRVSAANLFLFLIGILCGWAAYRGLLRHEELLAVAVGLFGVSCLVLSLTEMVTGEDFLSLLSREDTGARRWAVVGLGVAATGMCALCLAAAILATGFVRFVGIFGLLFFGVGGAFTVVLYWFTPAQHDLYAAIARTQEEDEYSPDE